jgi:GNAT superfamily N-acetyltransferase
LQSLLASTTSLIVRSDAQRNLGFNEFLESLSLKAREWWMNTVSSAGSEFFLPLMSLSKYGPALAPFIKTALSPHVCPILLSKNDFLLKDFQTVESSWYLNSISVDPKYQRQGIATNLIKMVEEKVWCSVHYDICQASSHLQAMTTSILALCTDTDDNVRDCRDRYKFAHRTAGCSIQGAPLSIQRRSTSTNSGR